MFTNFDRAVLFVDPLRPTYPANCPTRRNLMWIRGLFGPLIEAAGARPTLFYDVIPHGFEAFHSHLYGGLNDIEKFLKWATIYESGFKFNFDFDFREGDLVIGFELSPSTLQVFERGGIRYVDIRVHPIRFLHDLVFAFRTNDPEIASLLPAYRRDWDDVPGHVAMISGYFWRRNHEPVPASRIFLAQSRHDATVITNRRFLMGEDLLDALAPDDGRPLFVLPHPHDRDNPVNAVLVERAGAQLLAEENLYALLARAGEDVSFYTFTSGSGREAEAFGRNVTFLGTNHYGAASRNEQLYTPMDTRIFTPTPILRTTLGESWSYPFAR